MTGLLRPAFSEGQILGANDLNAHVTYDRLGAVLHERTEHLWGIAAGLELAATPRTTADGQRYVDVRLLPGRAVDRLGRVIVLTDVQDVEPSLFIDQIASPTATDRYPVYLQAIERPRTGDTRPGSCATGQPVQIEESFQLSFGGPGSEISILEQQPAPVEDGFGVPGIFDKVVVGWVTWNPKANLFASVETSSDGRGIRYAGVVASEVVAQGGTLALRTRPSGPRYALTLTEGPNGGGELRFGKQDGDNPVVPAFRIDEKGNVAFQGTLSPAPIANTLAESGVASDGVRLPLPAGVSEDQVDQGKVRIHAVLTPVPPVPRDIFFDGASEAEAAIPMVVRCLLDGDRRVRCRIRWTRVADSDDQIDLPGTCTYVLVASGK